MEVICVLVTPGVYRLAGAYFRVPSAVDARENPEIVGAKRGSLPFVEDVDG
jgi:hypothetical protein